MLRRITALSLAAVALAAGGCGGQKLHPVEGTVTLEGSPVEGASVTFISDDGKKTFGGQTDAAGKFTIYSGEKPGATAGTYKVLITKAKKVEGDMTPGSADYSKQMAKMGKEATALSPSSKAGGLFIPSGGAPIGPKGDLPPIYSAGSTTPFTVTVPVSGPVSFDMKGAPKKK